MKKIILGLLFIVIISCNSSFKYLPFDELNIPLAPDYSIDECWAFLPKKKNKIYLMEDSVEKNADVFYLYPTLLTNRKSLDWNADIWKKEFKKKVLLNAIKFQASAWTKASNLYAPFYRQAHYRIFFKPNSSIGFRAWEIAYQDIKKAFKYYLENFNKGKPIIIASHSQGSMHAKKLLKDFFDDKPLQKKLVAAYLIGTRVFPNEFITIKPMNSPNDVGGFVSWNSYKMNKLPKNYLNWYSGGVTSNPITWDKSLTSKLKDHKGILFKDSKIYPKSLNVKVIDGLLWTSVPNLPGKIFISFTKNYHFADINLFWKDIQENAVLRVNSWFIKKMKNEL